MVVPWGALASFILSHPEMGWILLFAWLLFELRSKKGRIYQLDKKITGAIIVVRALAQREDAINEDKVDDYLAENGMTPGDFIEPTQAATAKHSFTVEDDEGESDESLRGDGGNTPNSDERSTE